MNTPTGSVTFLFTDVEGSSGLWEEHGDLMGASLAVHDERLRDACREFDGYVFTTAGDSFSVAFTRPADALAAALGAQKRLSEPSVGPTINVRMALHTGVALERDGDYFGPVLNRCARLMSAGHGGQILVSDATASLLRDTEELDVELIDLGEHRLKDLTGPERVHQVASAELGRNFPALRTVDALSSTRPIHLTTFIGRSRELAEIRELLASARLVTLVGPGGAGKTRLALEVATEASDDFSGGTAFVELASITDPDLVASTMAAALDVRDVPGVLLVESIVAKVGNQRALLVVDNCEHLAPQASALVAELLKSCAGLTVLGTSQSRLGIAGELMYRVEPLSLPGPGASAEQALQFDAVQLFVDRAILANPTFRLTDENVLDVVAICERLDGIPLAIELAAARVKILAVTQILQRLAERFRLLAGPGGTDTRHQTLQATIDWSHDLLSTDEATLFRRCSPFIGGFSVESIEFVGTDEVIDSYDVLDLLSNLVDKSLVVANETETGTRFSLLQSMHHYALSKLEASNEAPAVRLRHLTYFADASQEMQAMYRSGELAEAIDQMRSDRGNLRAAFDRAIDIGDEISAGRIVAGLGYLLYVDGAFRQGIEWCSRLFATDPDLPPDLMAQVLHSHGTLVGSWSDPEIGAEILQREVVLRRELGDPMRLGAALNGLGNLWVDAGRREQGERALAEAVEVLRDANESPNIPMIGLGWSNMHAGDYDRAEFFYKQALEDAEENDSAYEIALATASMGQCALHLQRFGEARSLLDRARGRFADLGVTPGVQDAELHLALVDRAEGDNVSAAAHLLAALEEPDSHWYAAGPFWVGQAAGAVIDDDECAAELAGAAEGYYSRAKETQPQFIREDLDALSADLRARLGERFDELFSAGRRRPEDEIVPFARSALEAVIDTPRTAKSDAS